MVNIEHANKKISLDLRWCRKEINQKAVEHIINSKDMWNYWWFNEDKKWITTLKNWKITHYRTNEIDILLDEKDEDSGNVTQETKSEVLIDLFLSPENKVRNTMEAFEKAKYSNKTPIFWFISKWKARKAVIVLDFSKWKKPKETVYPLDKYNLKMKAVKI